MAPRAKLLKPAKLSRPQHQDILARERLFAWLDAHASTPVIWVVGPAGAGKTTLISSYFERRVEPVWYQVDAGDNDVSAFFSQLAMAAPVAGKQTAALPRFTPECLLDLPGFTRRFFREFFARFPESGTLIFDNQQDATAPEFNGLLREAFAEVPQTAQVVIISRVPPPPELARMQANRSLAVLDWELLRFSEDETQAMARRHGIEDLVVIAKLQAVCQGWAAGLVLLLSQQRHTLVTPSQPMDQSCETVFDYLATEVFERAAPEVQSFLLDTTFLPQMTVAMAAEISGNPHAESLLSQLHREHFFTDRRTAVAPTYQYHALFRAFLQGQVVKTLTPERQQALMRRSALLLDQDGQWDAAIHVLAQAQVWPEAVSLLMKHAQSLVMQGQTQTVLAWIDLIPGPVQVDVPWIAFWKGVCRLFMDPFSARIDLKTAYEQFQQQAEMFGQLMAAVAMVESYYLGWGRILDVEPWLDRILNLLAANPELPGREIELRAVSAAAWAMLVRRPQDAQLPQLIDRATELLEADVEVNQKLAVLCHILNYRSWLGDFPATRLLINRIDALLKDPQITPFSRAFYLGVYRAYIMTYLGSLDEVIQKVHEALDIIRTHNLYPLEAAVLIHEVFPTWLLNDWPAINRLTSEIEAKLQPQQWVERCFFLHQRATTELVCGQPQRAVEFARQARAVAVEQGLTIAVAWCDVSLAICAIELGDSCAALEHLVRTHILDGMGSQLFRYEFGLVEADARWQLGERGQSTALLRECLAIGRKGDFGITKFWVPTQISRFCAMALETGIEVEYVHRLIREHKLLPPSPDVEHWPWPVKIYTLGRFVVLRDGAPLASTGKAQHRLLDFLQALIALGSRNVSAATLAETLWPGTDADSAMSTLGSTLHRVRKLLGDADVVTLSNGVVSLDARRCWVDVWAFERGVARIAAPGADLPQSDLDALQEQVLRLYQGPFLNRESELTWMLAMRERLRNRFHQAIAKLGGSRERAQSLEIAAELYQRALEIDDRSEDIYRRLMTAQAHLGRTAEGLTTYERCRRMLADTFGGKPSRVTEALRTQLAGGG